MNWLQFAVQWLHVLLAILWFGYGLSMYFLIAPALRRLPEGAQREAGIHIAAIGQRVFPIVAPLVILFGIIRGTIFGPIDTLDALFGTAYGITFLVALLVSIGLIINGARNISPALSELKDTPDFAAIGARLQRYSQFDLVGFTIVFTTMVLMRFGL